MVTFKTGKLHLMTCGIETNHTESLKNFQRRWKTSWRTLVKKIQWNIHFCVGFMASWEFRIFGLGMFGPEGEPWFEPRGFCRFWADRMVTLFRPIFDYFLTSRGSALHYFQWLEIWPALDTIFPQYDRSNWSFKTMDLNLVFYDLGLRFWGLRVKAPMTSVWQPISRVHFIPCSLPCCRYCFCFCCCFDFVLLVDV